MRAVFDLGNVADADLRAAARADDDFAKLIGGGDAAESAKAEFLRASDHAAAGSFDVFALEGVAHIEDGEIVGGEFLRVEETRIWRAWPPLSSTLPTPSTVWMARRICLSAISVSSRRLMGPLTSKRENGIGLRILLGDDGRQSFARQSINGGGYFFADVLGGAVDIAFEDERAGDVGVAFAGVNGDFIDAADAGDGVFERENDAGDDFFGRRAGQAGRRR